MKIHDLQVFGGPSLFLSKPGVVARLTLAPLDEAAASRISDAALAGLEEALGQPGALRPEVQSPGSRAGRLVVHLALALQKRAGYAIESGHAARQDETNQVQLSIETYWPMATVAALQVAMDLASGLLHPAGASRSTTDTIRKFMERLDRTGVYVDHRYLVDAARRRAIPATSIGRATTRFGQGRFARIMHMLFTDATSNWAVMLSTNKTRTLALLAEVGVPIPRHHVVRDEAAAVAVAKRMGWPVVVKPTRTDRGVGVSVGLENGEAVGRAYRAARVHCKDVAVEAFVPGDTFRLLVVGGKFVAAARTCPATVTGDGTQTIRALLAAANRDLRRGPGHSLPLSWIDPDAEAEAQLAAQGLSWDAIAEPGRHVLLRSASNLSRGGMSVGVTESVHPENRALAELAVRSIGLDIAGIDVRARAIDVPLTEAGGAVIEVNATPGIRMHHSPAEGRPVDVAEPILDLLFPPGKPIGVPIAAVTGTNGKTTTTRMLAHALSRAGYCVGSATTGETAVGQRILATGDCAGPAYARRILAHPDVDAAVLETARGGIVKWGLGFETCDVAAVLNVADDHIGVDGIRSLDELARVKRLVADAATGAVILNAEDPRCVAMAQGRRAAKLIYFSLDPTHPVVTDHVRGGNAAYVLEGQGTGARVVRLAGAMREPLLDAASIPCSFGGSARYNLANAMAVMALAEGLGLPRPTVLEAISSFSSDFGGNPGRMNRYRGRLFEAVLDYSHNAHGLTQLLPALARIPAKGRRICCFGLNARSHDDEKAMRYAAMLAPHFDLFVPYSWDAPDKRREELPAVLRQGLLDAGVAEEAIRPCDREVDAIAKALALAGQGDLVVVFWGTDERRAWSQITSHQSN